MEWRDEGIILGVRRHGETSAILEVMTRAHGRHLGLVRGGRSRKQQPVLQAGNHVDLIWRARLDEHMGVFQVEPLAMHAARLMGSAAGRNFQGASDFKLLDRQVVEALAQCPERSRFFRGLVTWVGFKTAEVPFTVAERVAGETKWSIISMLTSASYFSGGVKSL